LIPFNIWEFFWQGKLESFSAFFKGFSIFHCALSSVIKNKWF
jgi:hypothetical protein